MAQFVAGEVLTAAKLNTAINGRPVNTQVIPSYTLAETDAGRIILASGSVQQIITVPADVSLLFPTGTAIGVFANDNASVSVVGDAGVTLATADGSGSVVVLPSAYSTVELVKVAANQWSAILVGSAPVSSGGVGGSSVVESGLSPLLLMGA